MCQTGQAYFHMSPTVSAVGASVTGNGRDKVDARIERALDDRRPGHLLSRRDAVYFRPVPEFAKCGIVAKGFIYRVEPADEPQVLDLTWIGELQKAQLKERNPQLLWVKHYSDWSADLLDRCSASYWNSIASGTPIWESLARHSR